MNHITECKFLINENSNVSYIPRISDLYSNDLQEQHYQRKYAHQREVDKEYQPSGPCELTMLCSAYISSI